MKGEALLILGMHRSGTSALAGALSYLGLSVGSRLMAPQPAINAKGFWENPDIVQIHDRLLKHLGSSWHDYRDLPRHWWERPEIEIWRQEIADVILRDYGDAAVWLVKDPRLCRLVSLWKPLLKKVVDETKIILIVRHPHEVADSLQRRDGISPERSHMLWMRSLFDSVRDTTEYPREIVTYDELLADWRAVIERIADSLDLSSISIDSKVRAKVEDFLEPALRHHVAQTGRNLGPIHDLVEAMYRSVLGIGKPSQLNKLLLPYEAAFAETEQRYAPWAAEIQRLWAERDEAELGLLACGEHLRAAEHELDRMKSTVSWRITKPLRGVANLPRILKTRLSNK